MNENDTLIGRLSEFANQNLWRTTTTTTPFPILVSSGHIDIPRDNKEPTRVFFDLPSFSKEENLTSYRDITPTPFVVDVIIRFGVSGNRIKIHVDTRRNDAEYVCAMIRTYIPVVEAYNAIERNERYGFLFWVVDDLSIPEIVNKLISGFSADPEVICDNQKITYTDRSFYEIMRHRISSPKITDASVSFPDHDRYYTDWIMTAFREADITLWVIPSAMSANELFSNKFTPDLPDALLLISPKRVDTVIEWNVTIYGTRDDIIEFLCAQLDLHILDEQLWGTETIVPFDREYRFVNYTISDIVKINTMIRESVESFNLLNEEPTDELS